MSKGDLEDIQLILVNYLIIHDCKIPKPIKNGVAHDNYVTHG